MTSPVCLLEQHRGQKLQRDFPLLCLPSSYQLTVAIARYSQQTNLPFTTLTVGQLGLFHPAFSAALMAALKLTRFGFTLHTGMVFLESQLRVRSVRLVKNPPLDHPRHLLWPSVSNSIPRCHCPLFSQALMVALMLMTFGALLAFRDQDFATEIYQTWELRRSSSRPQQKLNGCSFSVRPRRRTWNIHRRKCSALCH